MTIAKARLHFGLLTKKKRLVILMHGIVMPTPLSVTEVSAKSADADISCFSSAFLVVCIKLKLPTCHLPCCSFNVQVFNLTEKQNHII